ncbi:MAG: hypothetical protein M5Z89_04085 [Olivibacter sp.]|nr:hypothetical protein [Olivibacter sp. UJ_SKK_5.1]
MATTAKRKPETKKKALEEPTLEIEKKRQAPGKKDLSKSYNAFKQYGGKQYTGMAIGRSHHWEYDQGDWKETKITPDLWEIFYAVTKRRKGHAPKGSGVPVGTEYHWYILAHQNVKKLNANDYSTEMSGLKFKLAHKRADSGKWSTKAPTQRKHLVKFLKEIIAQLESDPIPLTFDYEGVHYEGEGIPITETCHEGVCYELSITLNDKNLGIIRCAKSGWKMDGVEKGLVKAIGNQIFLYFE